MFHCLIRQRLQCFSRDTNKPSCTNLVSLSCSLHRTLSGATIWQALVLIYTVGVLIAGSRLANPSGVWAGGELSPVPAVIIPGQWPQCPPLSVFLWLLPGVLLFPGACKAAPAFLRLRGTCPFGSAILVPMSQIRAKEEISQFWPRQSSSGSTATSEWRGAQFKSQGGKESRGHLGAH